MDIYMILGYDEMNDIHLIQNVKGTDVSFLCDLFVDSSYSDTITGKYAEWDISNTLEVAQYYDYCKFIIGWKVSVERFHKASEHGIDCWAQHVNLLSL